MRSLALVLVATSACAPLIAGTSRVLPPALQYDPASFAAPRMEREPLAPSTLVLPNGLAAQWAPAPADPLVDVALLVGCGRADDPFGSPELTQLALRSSVSTGTASLTARAQESAFERLGVELSITVGAGDSAIRFVAPRANLAAAMTLLDESLFSKTVDAQAFARWREDLATSVETAASQPEVGQVALMRRAVTSGDSGLGQAPNADALRAVTLEAVRAHASRCLQPANLVVALTGDLDEAAVRQALAALGRRPRGDRFVHPAPPPAPTTRNVWVSPELHGARVDITIVGRTPALAPRDRISGAMLAALLVSLVEYDLREVMGHAYSVSGDVEAAPGFGLVYLRFSTRAEKALESVRRVLEELQRWWTSWPVSPQVVEAARHAMSNAAARRPVAHQTLWGAERQLRDGAAFDARPWARQLDEVRAHHLADLFVLAFPPERLQVVVTGALGDPRAWARFGNVVAP